MPSSVGVARRRKPSAPAKEIISMRGNVFAGSITKSLLVGELLLATATIAKSLITSRIYGREATTITWTIRMVGGARRQRGRMEGGRGRQRRIRPPRRRRTRPCHRRRRKMRPRLPQIPLAIQGKLAGGIVQASLRCSRQDPIHRKRTHILQLNPLHHHFSLALEEERVASRLSLVNSGT